MLTARPVSRVYRRGKGEPERAGFPSHRLMPGANTVRLEIDPARLPAGSH